jgi:hypothetical protein
MEAAMSDQPRKPGPVGLPWDELKDDLQKLADLGFSQREIGEILGVSTVTINQQFAKLGILSRSARARKNGRAFYQAVMEQAARTNEGQS